MKTSLAEHFKTTITQPFIHSFKKYLQVESFCPTYNQSHYREVMWWEIFMEQELRFGLKFGPKADFSAFIASESFDL